MKNESIEYALKSKSMIKSMLVKITSLTYVYNYLILLFICIHPVQ